MAEESESVPIADSFLERIDVIHLGTSILTPRDTYGPMTAPCWILGWMLEGSATGSVNGRTVSMTVGDALLTQPGDELAYRWGPDASIRQGFVIFSAPEPRPEWSRHLEIRPSRFLAHILEHLLWLEAERPAGWWSAVGPAFAYALRTIASGYDLAGGSEHSFPAPIEDSMRFVARRWRADDRLDGITLADLASAAGVTREHLCRVYTQELGIGPVGAIRLLRLKRAATLLAQTNLSVAEVARRIGFGSEFHFSRTFKAASGESPSVFRADPTRSFDLPPAVRRLHNYLSVARTSANAVSAAGR